MLIAGEGRCRYSAYIRGGVGDVWQMKGLMTLVLGLLLAGRAVGQGDGLTRLSQKKKLPLTAHEKKPPSSREETSHGHRKARSPTADEK
jgi:hypothetical protein